MPLQIYLTESELTLQQLGENVLRQLESDSRCIVVVSEGFDVGELGTIRDNFGHVQFSSSQQTVAQTVVNYLNTLKFPVPGQGAWPGSRHRPAQRRCLCQRDRPGRSLRRRLPRRRHRSARGQRLDGHDPARSQPVGLQHRTTIRYRLDQVANSERFFPERWIGSSRIDVTDDFLDYAQPLIGEDWVSVPTLKGLPRFARISRRFAPEASRYVPQTYRKPVSDFFWRLPSAVQMDKSPTRVMIEPRFYADLSSHDDEPTSGPDAMTTPPRQPTSGSLVLP